MLWLSCKLLAVWYFLLGMSAMITGETNAYFSSQNQINGTIVAGTWEEEDTQDPDADDKCRGVEDHEILECTFIDFVHSKGSYGFDGEHIFAMLENKKFDMKKDAQYEVYYTENGNPKNGEVLTELLHIDRLKNGEKKKLTFKPEKNGIYMFKVYHDNDHPGEGNKEIWSDKIVVKNIKSLEVTEQTIENDVIEKSEETVVTEEANEEQPVEKETETKNEETPNTSEEVIEEVIEEETIKEIPDQQTNEETNEESSSDTVDEKTAETSVSEDGEQD